MFLAALLLTLAFVGAPAPAQADMQGLHTSDKACSLTVTLLSGASSCSDATSQGKPVSDGELTMYQVATTQGSALKFEAAFSGCGVGLDEVASAESASKLAAWVERGGVSAQASQTVGNDGRAVFSNLAQGVYLVVQAQEAPGYYALTPFVVSLPMTDDTGAGLVYDVEASPKVEPKPAEPVASTSFSVTKVWNDLPADETHADGTVASGSRIAHASVTVDLLKDGSLYARATLSTANNWAYAWDNLAGDAQWSVVEEQVPAGYSASYALAGDAERGWTATVTNSELAQKLIQTGQLKWPVPVLAGVGVVLFALGWWVCHRPLPAADEGKAGDAKEDPRRE